MRRVLVVDSEPHIQRLCLEEFRDEGYEVQVASTGGETIRLVDSFNPDMVVLEVLLPDMSGLEAGRMVKGSRKETRVVLFSNTKPPRDLKAWGADAYVYKTPDLEILKKTVRNLF